MITGHDAWGDGPVVVISGNRGSGPSGPLVAVRTPPRHPSYVQCARVLSGSCLFAVQHTLVTMRAPRLAAIRFLCAVVQTIAVVSVYCMPLRCTLRTIHEYVRVCVAPPSAWRGLCLR